MAFPDYLCTTYIIEKFLNELRSLSDKKARVPLQKGVKSHTAFTEECHSLAAELADAAAYYLRRLLTAESAAAAAYDFAVRTTWMRVYLQT